ncbi:chemotaxis protein MotB [Mariprofundus ferrinatatus]|uniref:Chemotaxis protein MotB n=1 Tax=Mariprofundus ferrinatatus TaxID=1921087 RepID=A0A2K8LAH0_9PROT|nr:OmpA family protein [Mariprofundus ferrinatatus]ATX82901.1 chemotaxis protein MotB [Mariprofundus ferrinatatus]
MARKSKKESEDPKSNFDMLFLQLMMIMMAFFILLSALSVIIDEKRLKALNSIAGAFNLMPAGANLSQKHDASMPSRELGANNTATKRTAKKLTNVAKLLGAGDAVHVLPLDKSTVRVRMQEQILFKPGQIRLTESSRTFIAAMAKVLIQPEIQDITIEGHTDKTPLRGKGAMGNWELSAARAMQVFHELANYNLSKSKLFVAGMGDARPLPHSETDGNEALNRRVELIIRFRPTTTQESRPVALESSSPAAEVPPGEH